MYTHAICIHMYIHMYTYTYVYMCILGINIYKHILATLLVFWNSCSEFVNRVSLIVGLVLFSGSSISVLFNLLGFNVACSSKYIWIFFRRSITHSHTYEKYAPIGGAPAVAQVTDKGSYTTMDYKHCAASVPTKAWDTDYSAVIWQVKWCLHGLTPVRPLVTLTTKVVLAPQQALPLSMAAAAVPGVP